MMKGTFSFQLACSCRSSDATPKNHDFIAII